MQIENHATSYSFSGVLFLYFEKKISCFKEKFYAQSSLEILSLTIDISKLVMISFILEPPITSNILEKKNT